MKTNKRALILVDIQNDFLPGGALAVTNGDQVVGIANELMETKEFDQVVATQDWHPDNHGSFAANHVGKSPGSLIDLNGLSQILWPVHCVQKSNGAEFASALNVQRIDRVFEKGTDPKVDSYSGFYDNGQKYSTGLGEYLKGVGITEVCILGLATDYCVKFTALDAISFGFKVTLIEDGCRAVNLSPEDGAKAIKEMQDHGVVVVKSENLK